MVSNNSSGMCCGVSQNTYHTLKDMRVVFADGTVLDTADSASRAAFLEVQPCPPEAELSYCFEGLEYDAQLGTMVQCRRILFCAFCVQSHKELCDGVVALATEVQSDQLLTNLIRRKFAIKCTTGVSPMLLHRVCYCQRF